MSLFNPRLIGQQRHLVEIYSKKAHELELLKDIAKDTGTSMVYVSHDLGAIAQET